MFVLLSYPRSGSNFLFYLLNVVLGYDCAKNHGASFDFWKREHKPIVFIIRDFKECVARQTLCYEFNEIFKSQLLNEMPTESEHHYDYIRLLDYFDQCIDKKIMVYYEDFIINPIEEFEKILGFLESIGQTYDRNKYEDLINNIDEYRTKSLERYASITTPSMSGGLDPTFHQGKMSENTIQDINLFIQTTYPYLSDKYLSRYIKQTEVKQAEVKQTEVKQTEVKQIQKPKKIKNKIKKTKTQKTPPQKVPPQKVPQIIQRSAAQVYRIIQRNTRTLSPTSIPTPSPVINVGVNRIIQNTQRNAALLNQFLRRKI